MREKIIHAANPAALLNAVNNYLERGWRIFSPVVKVDGAEHFYMHLTASTEVRNEAANEALEEPKCVEPSVKV